jgi:hypothetical protein
MYVTDDWAGSADMCKDAETQAQVVSPVPNFFRFVAVFDWKPCQDRREELLSPNGGNMSQ